MASLKAHEAEQFLNRANLPVHLYLIYGPDAGLVRERGRAIAQKFAASDNDMSLTSLDMSEIDADPGRLSRETRTGSLFGGAPIVRVRNATKKITDPVADLLSDFPETAIIIEAGNLTPKDKLRTLVEKSPHGMAIPCYPDTPEDRLRLIDQMMAENQITIDADARILLRDLLGNDREISRRELEKLVLYADQSKQLDRNDIEILCGDNSATTLDQIIDAMGTGHLDNLQAALRSAEGAGIDSQRILIAALNHCTWLRKNLSEAQRSNKRPIDVMNSAWPRPHFSRRRALELQARLWSDGLLQHAGSRLQATILATRQNPALSDALMARALLSLASQISKR